MDSEFLKEAELQANETQLLWSPTINTGNEQWEKATKTLGDHCMLRHENQRRSTGKGREASVGSMKSGCSRRFGFIGLQQFLLWTEKVYRQVVLLDLTTDCC